MLIQRIAARSAEQFVGSGRMRLRLNCFSAPGPQHAERAVDIAAQYARGIKHNS
jgi:hypothetical protein